MMMVVVTTPIIVTSRKLSMTGSADRRCRAGRGQQRTVEHLVGHSFQMPGQTRDPIIEVGDSNQKSSSHACAVRYGNASLGEHFDKVSIAQAVRQVPANA